MIRVIGRREGAHSEIRFSREAPAYQQTLAALRLSPDPLQQLAANGGYGLLLLFFAEYRLVEQQEEVSEAQQARAA